ncbi:MAG: hypothetical protein ACYC0E_15745, partial [Acidimicrobiales bacterium]
GERRRRDRPDRSKGQLADVAVRLGRLGVRFLLGLAVNLRHLPPAGAGIAGIAGIAGMMGNVPLVGLHMMLGMILAAGDVLGVASPRSPTAGGRQPARSSPSAASSSAGSAGWPSS